MGASEYRFGKASSDVRCPMSYSHNCYFLDNFLLHVCYAFILAATSAISRLYFSFFDRRNLRKLERSQSDLAFVSNLVTLCLLFPCSIAPYRMPSSHSEIYIRVSSPRYHFSWGICSVCYRSSWLLSTFPRNHKHFAHARLQFPHPILQGVCYGYGSC